MRQEPASDLRCGPVGEQASIFRSVDKLKTMDSQLGGVSGHSIFRFALGRLSLGQTVFLQLLMLKQHSRKHHHQEILLTMGFLPFYDLVAELRTGLGAFVVAVIMTAVPPTVGGRCRLPLEGRSIQTLFNLVSKMLTRR